MQKRILWIVLGLLTISSVAQDRRNSFKFLPVNLPLNSLSFEYERLISPHNSLELGLALPLNRPFIDRYTSGLEDDNEFSDDELGIFSVRAGFRHYTGQNENVPKGFYYSPYLKFQSGNGALNRTGVTDDEEPTAFAENYDVSLTTFGFGLQFGYQFLIARRINLDLYFFGLEAGWANATATIKTNDSERVAGIEEDINDAVDDLPDFLSKRIEVTSAGNSVNVKGKSIFYPWFRAGFSIGIAF